MARTRVIGKIADAVEALKLAYINAKLRKLVGADFKGIGSVKGKYPLPIRGLLASEFETIESLLTTLYKRTFFQHSGNTTESPNLYIKYGGMTVKFSEQQAVYDNGKLRLSIKAQVVGADGQPHQLWYWLSDGVESFTFNKPSAVFPIRERTRSSPDRPDAAKSPSGFVRDGRGNLIKGQFQAGQSHPGIQARNWQDKIGNEFRQQIRSRTRIKYRNIEYTYKGV